MTSKQKTGIIFILLGIFFYIKSFLPEYYNFLRPFFSWQMAIIMIGLYLILSSFHTKH